MILVRTCKKRNLSACARLSAVSPLALSSQQQQHPSNALVTHFMIHRSAADNYHHPPRHFTRNLNSSGKFSSSRDDRKSNDGSMQKLQSMGHSESVSKEVITALETLYGKGKVTVASLESFGDIGKRKYLLGSFTRREG